MAPFDDDIPVAQRQQDLPQASTLRKSWAMAVAATGAAVVLGGWALLSPLSSTPADLETDLDLASSAELASSALPTQPGAILGHLAYEEAPSAELEAVGTFRDRTERLRAAAARRYREMAAAARDDDIDLVPISGFRSTAVQEYLFFQRAQAQALRPQERAAVSAPPGYSEHHTGYAIDLGDASQPHTHLETSFDRTPAFAWLERHAARFGFELSFPADNSQGLSYEPWHWRFVGDRDSLATFYSDRPVLSSSPEVRP